MGRRFRLPSAPRGERVHEPGPVDTRRSGGQALVAAMKVHPQPFGKTTSTGPTNSNTWKCTGREDDGTTLYYYRARYYDPRLGRFISEDPIEFAGDDFNLYGYVLNGPINWRDSSGLSRDTYAGAAAPPPATP